MTKQTTNEKIVKDTAKYVWGRLKVMVLMIILIIVVKNHPGWDAFFFIILILQVVQGVIVVLKVPGQIEVEYKKRSNQEKHNQQQKWGNYGNNGSYKKQKISSSLELTNSAQILGINIRTDSSDDIKKRYRKLAMKWHPDRFSNDTSDNQSKAKRNFQKLNNAYEIVKKHKNFN